MGSVCSKQPIIQMEDSPDAQQFDTRMVQNISLIWLDSNIDEANTGCQNTIIHLRQMIDNIKTFTNADDCAQYLERIQYGKVYMIVSGSLGKQIMHHVHDRRQMESIFIFCDNRRIHEQWIQN